MVRTAEDHEGCKSSGAMTSPGHILETQVEACWVVGQVGQYLVIRTDGESPVEDMFKWLLNRIR